MWAPDGRPSLGPTSFMFMKFLVKFWKIIGASPGFGVSLREILDPPTGHWSNMCLRLLFKTHSHGAIFSECNCVFYTSHGMGCTDVNDTVHTVRLQCDSKMQSQSEKIASCERAFTRTGCSPKENIFFKFTGYFRKFWKYIGLTPPPPGPQFRKSGGSRIFQGAQTPEFWVKTYCLTRFLLKNCMKMKETGPRGWTRFHGALLDPPIRELDPPLKYW